MAIEFSDDGAIEENQSTPSFLNEEVQNRSEQKADQRQAEVDRPEQFAGLLFGLSQ